MIIKSEGISLRCAVTPKESLKLAISAHESYSQFPLELAPSSAVASTSEIMPTDVGQ